MSLGISPETQARLAGEAQKEGISIDILLQRLMDQHEQSSRGANGTPSRRPISEVFREIYRDAVAFDTILADATIFTTDEVLVEFMTFFSADPWQRGRAAATVRRLLTNPQIRVVE